MKNQNIYLYKKNKNIFRLPIFIFQLYNIIEASLGGFTNKWKKRKKIISYVVVILSPGIFPLFLLHVTFVPWHPEYTLIPAEFIYLPTILCDNYCNNYVYSDNMYDNDKIIFSMMPYSMCFVSKCINSTERMMVILPKCVNCSYYI